jgi:arylsulfatase
MKTRLAEVIYLLVIFAILPQLSIAYQPDAPFLEIAEKNKAKWAAEDEQIDAKLEALQSRFGKKPNIIYILADDIGWGELGWQGGGKHRGTPTPELDKLAYDGMRFWAAYAEPSCTPTRIAINTGRLPVRTGLLSVLWPGQTEGLSPEEVTVAEVLSGAGYHTAMWGKWHLGELPEHSPANQGYDYAYYGLYNGAPYSWPGSSDMYEGKDLSGIAYFYDFPGEQAYFEETGIRITPGYYKQYAGQKRQAVDLPVTRQGLADYEQESYRQIIDYVKDKSDSDKPFFIYWATYTQQITGVVEYMDKPGVDSRNPQASFMLRHNDHVKSLIQTLKDEGIAENTLLVWISDNGPMYGFWPSAGYTWLRGEKGQVTEGGIRVPAMAWWPGMIEANQEPTDILHVTDLFTTAARIGGAMDNIPSDRIVDGIDQTSLLLLGEGHGRRSYMFHYSGGTLGAIRYKDYKVLIQHGSHGGLPPIEVYNVKRDPGEKYGGMYNYLFAVTPSQNLMKGHTQMIRKFPHRVSETMPKGAEMTAHD